MDSASVICNEYVQVVFKGVRIIISEIINLSN